MPDFLSNVAGFFSSGAGKGLETLAGLGATGAGLAGNLSADAQRAAAAKQAQANMNLTPQQLAAQVSSATQPLNANLVQAITGNVNANMAEQGLSQAPGLQAEAIVQALAGPEQQNQNTAMQLVMQKLGLPAEFLKTIPPNTNMSQLLVMLMKGGGNAPTAAGIFNPTTGPTYTQAGLPDPSTLQTQGTYDFGGLIPPDTGGNF